MDQSINDSKSHIWNYFIENIIFGIQLFYIHPHVPADIMQVFFDYRFSRRKSQSQQKLLIKITYFAIQVCSKHLTHFTNLNSLDIENNMLPKHCQKYFWLYKFLKKHVSVWCQKKHLDCTISWNTRTEFLKHFESKCLYISVYLRFLFQRRSKILSDGMSDGGRWDDFLRGAFSSCLELVHLYFNFSF